jgi:hypothetical protein
VEGITGVKTGRFNVQPHLENGGVHPTESDFGKLELAITTQAAVTRQLEVWIVMNAILILLAVNAILGLVLGFYFSWKAIAVSALVLAFLSAAVLQNEGLGFLAGIGIIVICLTVNQMAYLIGITLVTRDPQDE